MSNDDVVKFQGQDDDDSVAQEDIAQGVLEDTEDTEKYIEKESAHAQDDNHDEDEAQDPDQSHDLSVDDDPDEDDDEAQDEHTDGSDDNEEEVLAQPLAPEKVSRILQALLLASGEPMTVARLSKCFSRPKPDYAQIKSLLKALEEEYAEHDFLRLLQTASGYQFQLASELSPWLLRLWEQKPPRYSRALLETLALVAYKQPITRGEIEQVRGVAVSNHIMKTLLDRGWISIIGQREVPGRPSLYATTKEFLDYFNLKRLSDLPDLPEIAGILEEKYGPVEEDPPIQTQMPLEIEGEVEKTDQPEQNTTENDTSLRASSEDFANELIEESEENEYEVKHDENVAMREVEVLEAEVIEDE